jgi:short chain dehydrogenase
MVDVQESRRPEMAPRSLTARKNRRSSQSTSRIFAYLICKFCELRTEIPDLQFNPAEPKHHKEEIIMGAHPNCKKIAVITGANRGIGFEVARQLGRRGMAVIIGTRDSQRGD